MNENKYTGCFLGLAIGDAYGALFEGGAIEQLFWKIIGKTRDRKLRYTDDTQMSIDLAKSFIKTKGIHQDHLATTFASGYQWSRGYGPGPGTAWLLKKIKNGADWKKIHRAKFKDGSYGNGAAMRAPILALCFPESPEKLSEAVARSSEVTHAHPQAIEGANLVAQVTNAALHDWNTETILEALPIWCKTKEYQDKLRFCTDSIRSLHEVQPSIVRKELGNGVAAPQSCVTAIYFSLFYKDKTYKSMLDKIIELGGDTDTIAAMAGAIWGAFNGRSALDEGKVASIENSEKIVDLAKELYALST